MDRLDAVAPPKVGMHHIALDRAWPDDRNLDNQVIEGARFEPREHRHLRTTFDLKRAERVRLADHRVGAWIFRRDRRKVQRDALVFGEKVEAPFHAGKHAERKAIDLHEFQRVDIVLVPFDDLAILHRGGFNWDEFVKPIAREDKAAGMLRKVARCPHQIPREIEGKTPRPWHRMSFDRAKRTIEFTVRKYGA